jgi:hypothetical protein
MHVGIRHGLATDDLPIQERQAGADHAKTSQSCRLAGEETWLERANLGFLGGGLATLFLASFFEGQEAGQGIPGRAGPQCPEVNAIP